MYSNIHSAVEFMDEAAMDMYYRDKDERRLTVSSPFYFLVETSGSNAVHDAEKMDAFLEYVLCNSRSPMSSGRVVNATEKNIANDGPPMAMDGYLCQNVQQFDKLWAVREGVGSACKHAGTVYKYDISLPLRRMYELAILTKKQLQRNVPDFENGVRVMGYGHLGDGNLHINVVSLFKEEKQQQVGDLTHVLEPWIFEETAKMKGSISAEHGIGQSKPGFMHLAHSPETVALMKTIKAVLDPKNILNPGKVLPD